MKGPKKAKRYGVQIPSAAQGSVSIPTSEVIQNLVMQTYQNMMGSLPPWGGTIGSNTFGTGWGNIVGGGLNPGAPGSHPSPDGPAGTRGEVSAAVRNQIAQLVEKGRTQPLLAYRGWGLSGGGMRLMPVGVSNAGCWPVRRLHEAVCVNNALAHQRDHEAPEVGCHCGIYGFTHPASLMQVASSRVLGRVQLGGAVVVCVGPDPAVTPGDATTARGSAQGAPGEKVVLGLRAQTAYPSAFFLFDEESMPDLSVASYPLQYAAQLGRKWFDARRSSSIKELAGRNEVASRLADVYGVEASLLPDELRTHLRAVATAFRESLSKDREAGYPYDAGDPTQYPNGYYNSYNGLMNVGSTGPTPTISGLSTQSAHTLSQWQPYQSVVNQIFSASPATSLAHMGFALPASYIVNDPTDPSNGNGSGGL